MSGSVTEFLKNPKLNLTMEKNIFPSTNLFTPVDKISTTINKHLRISSILQTFLFAYEKSFTRK